MFLTAAELRELTGYAHSGKQVAQLRRQGIAFWINGAGRPVVSRTAIEGGKDAPQPSKTWEPAWAASPR